MKSSQQPFSLNGGAASSNSLSVLVLLWLAGGGGLGWAAMTPDQVKSLPPPATRRVNFGQDIKPIFETSCVHCHGHGRDKGEFRLDTRATVLQGGDSGPALVPGRSAGSRLIELVAGVDPENIMPQKGKPLTPVQIGLLRAWIDQGAKWDSAINFSKQPPQNLSPRLPKLPAAKEGITHPVDRLLQPYFKRHRFKPAPPVNDLLFARRVFFDVIGLPPSPEELHTFFQDTRPDKRALLVERLLADDRRYAEHWLTFWNDLLRNDYRGTGYIDGGRKPISAWLYAALTTNMPYDQFVAKLVAPAPESEGFVKGIIWRGTVNASQTPPMQAAQGISQVFLGVNLKCASCHDSFVSDWTLADAYGLAAVFADGPLEMVRCDKPTGNSVAAKFLYPELGDIQPDAPKLERQKRLAQLLTGKANGRLSRTIVNRLWQRFFGVGLVEAVDDMEQPAWNRDLLDWLAEDLGTHGFNLKHTMQVILTSAAYQLPAVSLDEQKHNDFVFAGPAVRRLNAEQFRDAVGELTGVWYSTPALPAATPAVRASLVAADPLAIALGRPNREQIVPVRPSAATTLQALELTNGETLSRILARGAEKLLAAPPVSSTALVERVYRQALGRLPTAAEQQLANGLLGEPPDKEGLTDLLWAMAMLPEFQLIY